MLSGFRINALEASESKALDTAFPDAEVGRVYFVQEPKDDNQSYAWEVLVCRTPDGWARIDSFSL